MNLYRWEIELRINDVRYATINKKCVIIYRRNDIMQEGCQIQTSKKKLSLSPSLYKISSKRFFKRSIKYIRYNFNQGVLIFKI